MKNLVKKTVAVALIIFLVSLTSCAYFRASIPIEYTELGVASPSVNSEGEFAGIPWDLIVWDDKLFIGGGDYDTNAGPVDIWCYDIQKDVWINSGTVPDEEINRFVIMDDCLVSPGVDPKDDWSLGNFYYFENGSWTTVRNIPGGIHCFDIVEYNDNIFVGLGVKSGNSPVAVSSDGGGTFTSVQMKKNGVTVNTSGSNTVRVYDLFIFQDTLYAAFLYGDTEKTYDLYRYNDGVFVFDNEWNNKIHQIKYNHYIIGGKAEFNGSMYFTTGYLYTTGDMANFTRIAFPNDKTVYDIFTDKTSLYVLCGEKIKDGRYEVSVWENDGGDATNFKKLFSFIYDVAPLSMTYDNGTFFIGMGEYTSNNDKNGMILRIDFSK